MNTATTTPLKPVLTNDEAAEYLGIAANTLEQWRCSGRHGIPYVKIGKKLIRYRLADLEKWLAENCVGASDE